MALADKVQLLGSGLNDWECRGLEQFGMVFFHTLRISDKSNQINGVGPLNPMGPYYEMARLNIRYISNQLENEYLNIFDKK